MLFKGLRENWKNILKTEMINSKILTISLLQAKLYNITIGGISKWLKLNLKEVNHMLI